MTVALSFSIFRSCCQLEHLNLGSCTAIQNYDDVAVNLAKHCSLVLFPTSILFSLKAYCLLFCFPESAVYLFKCETIQKLMSDPEILPEIAPYLATVKEALG